MNIKLFGKKTYEWSQINNYWICGNYKYYDNKETLSELQKVHTLTELKQVVDHIKGEFSLVLEVSPNEYFVACDAAKAFPIYFDSNVSAISDKTSYIKEMLGTRSENVDPVSFAELLGATYTPSYKTVYKHILQCDAGECVYLNANTHSYQRERFFCHFNSMTSDELNDTDLNNKFEAVLEDVFSEMIESLKDRPVVLPLSGGYDSRLIAAELKNHGIDDVICYTYGLVNKGDEVNTSRDVAAKLGYKWYFVEYTNEKWNKYANDKSFLDYCNYVNNDIALPHIQEFIALKELISENKIPSDAVIIPGFSADLPAGSFITSDVIKCKSINGLANYLFDRHYKNCRFSDSISNAIIQDIIEELNSYSNTNGTQWNSEWSVKLNDAWVTNNRVTQYIINALRLYEYFGLKWRIPFWDKRFLNFWYKLGIKRRINCCYYKDFLFSGIFSKYDIAFRKPYHVVFRATNDSKLKRYLFACYDDLKTIYGIKLGIVTISRANINNFNYGAKIIYRSIKNKKILNSNYIAITQILSLWWCELEYGDENIFNVYQNKGHE